MTGSARVESEIDRIAAERGFSGVVRLDAGPTVALAKAYGQADRAFGIPNRVDTRFAIASGAKGFTALVVVSLIEEGILELGTPVRLYLGEDLPLIDDAVTVEHLLSHRSGIGDYLDESAGVDLADYLLRVPAQALSTTEDYLAVLEGHPPAFAPDERFAYNNSGYVVLALVSERAAGRLFYDLVDERVCRPAALTDTSYLRSDELPGRTARGYVEGGGLRTNVFHLPVRGSGDGGIYSTAADIHALWTAIFEGRVVSGEWVTEMTRPRSKQYGLGFWLDESAGTVVLEGSDTGVSFRSIHRAGDTGYTRTVISNVTSAAWPLARYLASI